MTNAGLDDSLDAMNTPDATPAAVAHAEEVNVDLANVEGTGTEGRITKADVAAAAADANAPVAPAAPNIHFLQAERASLQMNRDALVASLDRKDELAEIDRQLAEIDKALGG
jgi:2-oxoglutarate dehydrogenase E2 component (dihydrolipoamide succinyltransferase)